MAKKRLMYREVDLIAHEVMFQKVFDLVVCLCSDNETMRFSSKYWELFKSAVEDTAGLEQSKKKIASKTY